jgi:Spy/CpxP family protein refolding chaperone
MNKDNFYRFVIIALLLLNSATLAFMWFAKDGEPKGDGHRPPRPDQLIKERLALDDAQSMQFDGFKHEHHSAMVDLQIESSDLHQTLFALLKAPVIDTASRDSIITQIQELSRQKELITFEHFRQVRSILNDDQQTKFDAFVEEISRRILGPHREGRP